jgi:threonine dehydratase
MTFSREIFEQARARIGANAYHTPLVTSRLLSQLTGCDVRLKAEMLQRTGSYKIRGPLNKFPQLSAEQKARGVICSSAGNHAQGVAKAAAIHGIKAVVVMAENATPSKIEATRGYGAEVVQYAKHEERETLAGKLAAERGLTLIPPFDHAHIIAGQGTAAKELIEDVGPLDVVMTPCGGGGLLSGCAIAAKHLAPGCRVIGVEPAAGDDATQSFAQKKLVTIPVPDTIADGARTPSLGRLTFPIVLRYVDAMLTVTDEELKRAMFFLWERMKVVVEPTGALAFASLFTEKISMKGKRIGVVLSGGNVDLRWAAAQIDKQ